MLVMGLFAIAFAIGITSVQADSASNDTRAGAPVTYVEKVDTLVRDGNTLNKAAANRAEAARALLSSVPDPSNNYAAAADLYEQAAEQYKGAFKLTGDAKTKFDAADHLWNNPTDKDRHFAKKIADALKLRISYKNKAIESYMNAAKERDKAGETSGSPKEKAIQKGYAARNRESAVNMSDEASTSN
jgi:hypothetical protein